MFYNYTFYHNISILDKIFDKQPVPSNYSARSRQVVRAEGFVILNQTLLYGPNGVVVGARMAFAILKGFNK